MTDARTMTDRTALVALRDAVREGRAMEEQFRAALPGYDVGIRNDADDARRAYHGFLDAALALHNALLPKWGLSDLGQVILPGRGALNQWHARIGGPEAHQGAYAEALSPARAWLLAILEVLIQEARE